MLSKTSKLFRLLTIAGIITWCLQPVRAEAAKVDTVLTYSTVMHKSIKAVIIKPEHYSTREKLPALYLLHGYSGNYADWVTKAPVIRQLADTYHMLIICPDGNFASWYIDSPNNPASQYDSYITKELLPYVDQHYATIANRAGRAITGLSMGGHGAMYLAFKHPELFGAAGSMSGGVDLWPFASSFGVDQVLGKQGDFPERWREYSIINLADQVNPQAFALIIDCGHEDFMYEINMKLHEKLLDKKIPHDFIIRPGAHTWEYWGNSIQYQSLFFDEYFKRNKKTL
jgi:S-formylglutathione hydrolase FrmB